MRNQTVVGLLAAWITCLCTGLMPPPPPKPTETNIQWFLDAVKEADNLELLEGVPHPYWEPEERAHELSKHPTTTIAKQVFYSQRLTVTNLLKQNLTAAFLENTLYDLPKANEPLPTKACGGFHADYGVQWLNKDKPVAAALVCFGCNEIHIMTDEAHSLVTDMAKDGGTHLESILKPLRSLRPPFRQFEKLRELKKQLPQPEKLGKIDFQLP